MPQIQPRAITHEEWIDLGEWSKKFHARDYESSTRRFDEILESDDWQDLFACISVVSGVLVKRIIGGIPSADAGELLYRIAGPGIGRWLAYMDVAVPDEEVVRYLSTGNTVVGQGEKSTRAILIAIGTALSFYREDLFEEVTDSIVLAIGMINDK